MKLTRGKHYFWSRLLFGMIAIFVLPQVQEWQHTESGSPTYQNQSVSQQIVRAVQVFQREQVQQVFAVSPVEPQKLLEFRPHFSVAAFSFHVPIRASPRV